MKRTTLICLALAAMFLIPTGAFAHDKHDRHHRDHDWSCDWRGRDDHDYRKQEKNARTYWEHQRQMEADRVANGYYPDGTPRYPYYPRYYDYGR